MGWITREGGVIVAYTSHPSPDAPNAVFVPDDDPDVVAFNASPTVPEEISDRQFFQRCAGLGVVSESEALAAVQTGALPAALAQGVAQLPADLQFPAKMMLCGAVTFRRHHPMTAMLGQIMGWSSAQLDALWIAAAQL